MNDVPTYRVVATVVSEYLANQSQPDNNQYVFAYHVTIENKGNIPSQLISRHWIITDGNKNVEEVVGEGVVGEKPLIHPGQRYQYSSGAILRTPVGTMHGSFQFVAADGKAFEADIAPFTLAYPRALN